MEPPPQQRAVLALLVARLRSTCRRDQLTELVWGDEAPENADRLLQGLISRLRGLLGPHDGSGSRLVTVADGWRLDLSDEQVDTGGLVWLVRDAEEAAEEGNHQRARGRLEEALRLWRGRPFAELADHPMLAGETARLDEIRMIARERLLELRLAAGRHDEAATELRGLTWAHPFRENLHRLLMLALHRAGRQADALSVYEQLRERLATELGTDPAPEIQALHTAILRQEVPSSPSGARSRESSSRRSPAAWPCSRDLPLVGRDEPLAQLEDLLERTRTGLGQVALISGEPGIGKTRLVAELSDHAVDRGSEVLVGRCTAGAALPYQPFVEALRTDVEATSDVALADRLDGCAGELARLLPALADRTGQRPPPESSNPDIDRHRLFTAVARWLTAAARTSLVLVLEDLHAATRPTLLLLQHLVQTTAGAHLLMVATYRDTPDDLTPELRQLLAEVSQRPDVTHLALEPLATTDVQELVAADKRDRLPGGQESETRRARQLHRATGGNPLFVQELLAVRPDTGQQPASDPFDGRLPWSLRKLLDHRIDGLSSDAKLLLQQAAVSGETFDFAVVATATPVDEDTALDGLQEAVDARFVTPSGTHDDRYRFAHAVMRAALLEGITPSRRMRLHARLANALEQRHADDLDAVLADLAHHHAEAGTSGDPAKAVTFARAAGDTAMDKLAYEEAAEHYRRALYLTDDPQTAVDADPEERCDLLIALGEAQQRAGPGEHSQTVVDAIELATQLADADRLARAAWTGNRGFPRHLFSVDEERVEVLERAIDSIHGAPPGPRAILTAVLAAELTFHPDRARTRRLSDQAVRLAREAQKDPVLARVLSLRQFTIQAPTTVQERLTESAELMDLVDHLDDPSLAVFTRWWRAIAALEAGDRSIVDMCVEEALTIAEELGEPFIEAATLMLVANRELAWGDLDRVIDIAERYRELGTQADATDMIGPYLIHRLWVHRERGETEAVVRCLERHRRHFGEMPHNTAETARAYAEAGQLDSARTILDRFTDADFDTVPHGMLRTHILCALAAAAALCDHTAAADKLNQQLAPHADQLDAGTAFTTGSIAHYLGLLATTLGDLDDADRYLDQATRIHQRVGAERWLNRTRLAHARVLLARNRPGDEDAARRLLARTRASAQREGQTSIVTRCDQHQESSARARPTDRRLADTRLA